jgi:surfeit locus 1 family protein
VRLRFLWISLVVLTAAAVCVRLGFWQISRWHEKRALNAGQRSALARPPLMIRSVSVSLDSSRGRRLEARGHFDESRQILLSGRAHDGAPGVHVVTPLVLSDGGSAVLVDRGWLYAQDAAFARTGDASEPGAQRVLGVGEPLRRGAGGPPLRLLPAEGAALYSARWLDLDSLTSRFPYALAPVVLRQLPGPGVPDKPLRQAPTPANESMHLSYAIQWFLFAAIILGGSAALVWSRRSGAVDGTSLKPESTFGGT